MIILIHGAWHGAWAWDRVIGPGMVAPELDLSPGTTLSAHVAAIETLIDDSPVTLVGHSYGAAVAHIVASRHPERVRRLVCLDGFVLRPGQTVIDLIPPRIRAGWLQHPMVPPLGVDVMAVNHTDRDWLAARLRPHPLGCFTEAAPEIAPYAGPRMYVRASGFAFPPFDRIFKRCEADNWQIAELCTGHDLMLAEPAAVKRLLA